MSDRDQARSDYLARIETVPTERRDLPAAWEPAGLSDAYTLATVLARSGLVPKALQGKPEDVLLVIVAARELGIPWLQATQGKLHVVHGRIGMAAEEMRSRAMAHPDCEYFAIESASKEQATARIRLKGWEEHKDVTFTLQDARQAGLIRAGGGWESWTEDMLVARATSRCVRRHLPQALGPVRYTPEELRDTVIEEEASRPVKVVQAQVVEDRMLEQLKASLEVYGPKEEAPAEEEATPEPEEPEEGPDEAEEPTSEEPPPEPSTAHDIALERLLGHLKGSDKTEEELRDFVFGTWKRKLEDLPVEHHLDAFAWIKKPKKR